MQVVSCYLGFAREFENVPDHKLSLALVTNQGIMANFFSYMMARCTAPQYITQIAGQLVKVLVYLRCQDPHVANDEAKQRHIAKVQVRGTAWVWEGGKQASGHCYARPLQAPHHWRCTLLLVHCMPRGTA